MKKKQIELMPWQAEASDSKEVFNVKVLRKDFGKEDTLIVDISNIKPFLRMCFDGKKYAIYAPQLTQVSQYRYGSTRDIKMGWSERYIMDIFTEYHRYYMMYSFDNCKISSKDTNTIRKFFNSSKKTWYDIIKEFEDGIRRERNSSCAEKRRKKRESTTEMWTQGWVPLTMEEKKKAMGMVEKHYMRILRKAKSSTVLGRCTACYEEVEFPKNTAFEIKECPCCKAPVTPVLRAKQDVKGNYTFSKNCSETKEVIKLEVHDELIMERHIEVSRQVCDGEEQYGVWEKGLIVLDIDTMQQKELYRRGINWSESPYYGMGNCINLYKGQLMPGNVEAILQMERFKYCGLQYLKDDDAFVIDYLTSYIRFPQVELLMKLGFKTLCFEIKRVDLDLTGKKPWEILKINKLQFNRMLNATDKETVDCNYLKWLQYENSKGYVWDDDDIQFMTSTDSQNYYWYYRTPIDPKDLEFIMDRLSLKQIRNYLQKMKFIYNKPLHNLISTWKDYLSMCEKAKKRLDLIQVYKPTDLIVEHNRLTNEIKNKGRQEAIEKKFPELAEVFDRLGMFEYNGDKYSVVVPQSVKDLVDECNALGHCLIKNDIYVDRMVRDESYILFLRKNEDLTQPFFTMEVEPGGTVRQVRTTGDSDKGLNELRPFIKEWQKAVSKKLDAEARKRAEKSASLREEEFEEMRKTQKTVWHGIYAGTPLVELLERTLIVA